MRSFAAVFIVSAGLVSGLRPALAEDDNAAANRLFVEAVKLLEQAEAASTPEEALKLYQHVKGNIEAITNEHPSSDLAVRIVLGEPLGPINLDQLEHQITANQPEAIEAERALRLAVEAVLSRSISHQTTNGYHGILRKVGLVFGPGEFPLEIWFTSLDPTAGTIDAVTRGVGETKRTQFHGRLENPRHLVLRHDEANIVWDLQLDNDYNFAGSYSTPDGLAVVSVSVDTSHELTDALQEQMAAWRCQRSPTTACAFAVAEMAAGSSHALRDLVKAHLRAGDFAGGEAIATRLSAAGPSVNSVAAWSALAAATEPERRQELAATALAEAKRVLGVLTNPPQNPSDKVSRLQALDALAATSLDAGDRAGAAVAVTEWKNLAQQFTDVSLDEFPGVARQLATTSPATTIKEQIDRGQLSQAVSTARAIADPPSAANALVDVSAGLLNAGRTQEAFTLLDEATDSARQFKYNFERIDLLLRVHALELSHRPDEAAATRRELMTIAKDDRTSTPALIKIASAHQTANDRAAAQSVLTEFLDRLRHSQNGVSYDWINTVRQAALFTEPYGSSELVLQMLQELKKSALRERSTALSVDVLAAVAELEHRFGIPSVSVTMSSALDLAHGLKVPYQKAWGLEAAAIGQAGSGTIAAALDTAATI